MDVGGYVAGCGVLSGWLGLASSSHGKLASLAVSLWFARQSTEEKHRSFDLVCMIPVSPILRLEIHFGRGSRTRCTFSFHFTNASAQRGSCAVRFQRARLTSGIRMTFWTFGEAFFAKASEGDSWSRNQLFCAGRRICGLRVWMSGVSVFCTFVPVAHATDGRRDV